MLVKIESTNQGSLQYSLLINSTINYTIKTQKKREGMMGPFSVLSRTTQFTKSSYSSKGPKAEPEEALIEPKFPIKQFEYIEGRNYRQSKKPSEQFLPCDDEEIERLQINQLLFKTIDPYSLNHTLHP
ncbi:hypothetical protein RO3G_12799 [Rhizopus delemar RA 99-880]|uniref:Uncharacterized protein n=1 Tax=Rhizopus delemar (strain RA 99-880 / ATCC MYA-4621 / FGSC 9543 / NRRL 43880) TaxID=246409 RepID=I1CI08_RHIO9|nr:hypothetical protein RO3G_12799 [Rhizopus delemar RA 99-880]|eukprot:EIE88088.1 hypothetical protein RO3G_12799 [Rhizopus delemar RA 99-880]